MSKLSCNLRGIHTLKVCVCVSGAGVGGGGSCFEMVCLPCEDGLTRRTEFTPLWSRIFPVRVDSFQKGH